MLLSSASEGCLTVPTQASSLGRLLHSVSQRRLYSDTEQAACRGLQGLLLLLEPSGAKEATKDRRRTAREE